MRTILVMNPKGGCGKSTISTNLAAYCAQEGYRTTLADFDPQESSLDWLSVRPDTVAEITGIAGHKEGFRRLPRSTEYLIIDAPARSHGKEMAALVKKVQTVLVPVLPSPIDMMATTRFVEKLRDLSTIQNKRAKIGVIANRVRENTLIFDELDEYLDSMKRIRYVAVLREAQNYNRAFSKGLGIHELPSHQAWPDWEYWDPLLDWLWSRSSRP